MVPFFYFFKKFFVCTKKFYICENEKHSGSTPQPVVKRPSTPLTWDSNVLINGAPLRRLTIINLKQSITMEKVTFGISIRKVTVIVWGLKKHQLKDATTFDYSDKVGGKVIAYCRELLEDPFTGELVKNADGSYELGMRSVKIEFRLSDVYGWVDDLIRDATQGGIAGLCSLDRRENAHVYHIDAASVYKDRPLSLVRSVTEITEQLEEEHFLLDYAVDPVDGERRWMLARGENGRLFRTSTMHVFAVYKMLSETQAVHNWRESHKTKQELAKKNEALAESRTERKAYIAKAEELKAKM